MKQDIFSKYFGAKQDLCSNNNAKQDFCSNISNLTQDFFLNSGVAKKNFCLNIWVQSLSKTFVRPFCMKIKPFINIYGAKQEVCFIIWIAKQDLLLHALGAKQDICSTILH